MKLLARNTSVLALLAVLGVFGTMALRGPNGVPALMEKRKEIQVLQERNASMAAENQRKRERIERLKHSRSEQEMEIRNRLKLLKKNETQFITTEPPADPAADAPVTSPASE